MGHSLIKKLFLASALLPLVASAGPNGIIVKLKPGVQRTEESQATTLVQKLKNALGGLAPLDLHSRRIGRNLVAGLHVVDLPNPAAQARALAALGKDATIEYAEKDYPVSAFFGRTKPTPSPTPSGEPTPPVNGMPNDPDLSKSWGVAPQGSGGSAFGANVVSLWQKGVTGSSKILVAVVDTGIDYNHPDLKDNVVGKGYNTIKDGPDALDDNGHGTHVAGIIGAVGNNGKGTVGVNWTVSLLGIKFLSGSGSGNTSDGIEGIDYAVSQGAQVINCSWGGPDGSQALKDSIINAGKKNVLVVAAAGNSAQDTDVKPMYPAAFHLDNMIVVAATDKAGAKASFTNYGAKTVDVSAPGVDIYNTYKNGAYKSLSGTSMASPMVAGAAALVLSQNPAQGYAAVKSRILGCVTALPNGPKTTTMGLLNTRSAYEGCR